jgi:biopolymer transport protein ExbD
VSGKISRPEDSKSGAFDLAAPQEELAGSSNEPFADVVDPLAVIPVPPPPETDESKAKPLAWKGFELEEEYAPEMSFPYKRDASQDEMDMTPMVDVTFLLLIFFMVTASFASQRANEPPPSLDDLPSTNVISDPEDQNDYVEVIIDQNNAYRITSRDLEEVEAPSDIQMRAEMKNAKDALNARKLLVTAHENAWHERVVKVLDYGATLGFEEVQAKTTTQEY